MDYRIGDRIVHPLHGAGEISEIEVKRVEGKNRSYYVMHIPKGDMRVMIPTDACDRIGIRPVIGREQADEIFRAIPAMETAEDSNWNRRYRENMVSIRSGDLLKVAAVIKSLVRREAAFGLSNGERKMLHSAKQIFISEMMFSQERSYEAVERELYSVLDEGRTA